MKDYVRFTGLILQMGGVILAAALGGKWLDDLQGNSTPIWTLVLTLIAIFGSLFRIIYSIIKKNKNEEGTHQK